MGKLQWIPWMALSEMGREPERVTSESVAAGRCGYAWSPAADVVETNEELRVTLELPGVARDAVSVEIRARFLVVRGLRCMAREPGGMYQIMERSYGPFLRRFALPRGMEHPEITAVMREGLLYIIIRKTRPELLHRRIPID